MKKYFIVNNGLSLEIDKDRVIKIKALQTYYYYQKIGKNVSYKEIFKSIKQEIENEIG